LRVLKDSSAEAASSYRWGAAQALGAIAPGTPHADEVVTALIESLKSPGYRHPAGINALGEFGSRAAAAIPRLKELQDSRDQNTKTAATQTLARIKGVAR
jgi:HEAT repeat protein